MVVDFQTALLASAPKGPSPEENTLTWCCLAARSMVAHTLRRAWLAAASAARSGSGWRKEKPAGGSSTASRTRGAHGVAGAALDALGGTADATGSTSTGGAA